MKQKLQAQKNPTVDDIVGMVGKSTVERWKKKVCPSAGERIPVSQPIVPKLDRKDTV